MITSFDAYRLYVGVKMHFTKPDYDVKASKGRGFRLSESALERRNDAPMFRKAAAVFNDPKDWIHCCVAGHLVLRPWVGDILQEDQAIYRQYQARRQKMGYQYQQDLQRLLDTTPADLSQLSATLAKWSLGRRICPESAVLLNNEFGWLDRHESTDTLLWPKQRMLLQKYSSFVPPARDRYKALTEKVLTDYPMVARRLNTELRIVSENT